MTRRAFTLAMLLSGAAACSDHPLIGSYPSGSSTGASGTSGSSGSASGTTGAPRITSGSTASSGTIGGGLGSTTGAGCLSEGVACGLGASCCPGLSCLPCAGERCNSCQPGTGTSGGAASGTSGGTGSGTTGTVSTPTGVTISCGAPPPVPDCDGTANFVGESPGITTTTPPADAGEVGLWQTSAQGTLLVIGAGEFPGDTACLTLQAQDCGHCSWMSLSLPPGLGTGTYDVADAGIGAVWAQEGIGWTFTSGTVTLTSAGPATLAGSFDVSVAGDCGLCSASASGSFSIPSSCGLQGCGSPGGSCDAPTSVYSVPRSTVDEGLPVQSIFLTSQDGSILGAAAADNGNTAVDIYVSDGDGGLVPGQQLFLDPQSAGSSVSGWYPGIAAGDLNGDGVPDIVASCFVGVGVLLGNGDGTYQTPVFYGRGAENAGEPSVAAIGDLNGDGHPDVAVADFLAGSVDVLYGNGNGTLQAPVAIVADAGLVEPSTLVLADFDNDGNLDVVVEGKQLMFVPGQGGSGFGAPTVFGPQPALSWVDPQPLATAELRPGSGLQDLVFVNLGDGGIGGASNPGFGLEVMLGNGNGTFQAPVEYTDTCLYSGAGPVTVGDVNGDGKPDLVGAFNSQQGDSLDLGVWFGNGDGTFTEGQTSLIASHRWGFSDVTTVSLAPAPGGSWILTGYSYASSITVQQAASACFGP